MMGASTTVGAFFCAIRGMAGRTGEEIGASGTMENGALRGMSLKAKLEAVIYAAEEPVTLAQLAGLFADEALELKAEREAAAAAQGATTSEAALPLNQAFPHLGLEPVGETGHAESEAVAQGEAGEGNEAAAEAEAKRAAKLREREARAAIKQVLDELIAEYAADGRGI